MSGSPSASCSKYEGVRDDDARTRLIDGRGRVRGPDPTPARSAAGPGSAHPRSDSGRPDRVRARIDGRGVCLVPEVGAAAGADGPAAGPLRPDPPSPRGAG